ncbi:MAG: peptidyl-prolyl cis-trans isomerase [Paludibacter sp.]|nr:peptidyl-prolyl cis-trans isomerase [Paludibacter sp.]
MRMVKQLLLILTFGSMIACVENSPDQTRVPLLEVEGKFLYLDQVQNIIPPNMSGADSVQIVDSYIRKWITDVLLYENAKRNVTDKAAIEKLLEDYKKSLTIHQYQQNLIQQRLPEQPSEEDMRAFYDQFSAQFELKENLLKGILLVVPVGAPNLTNVRRWVQSADLKSLEQIEKYSLQHGLSYDYFLDRWVPLNEILRKMPIQLENQTNFLNSKRYYEVSDSLKHYMISIESTKMIGEIEPYETARDKISNIILNKLKSEFITNFEDELYHDAIQNGTVTFLKK